MRFSLKDRAYFKPSVCNTKVGKSKTKFPVKATFGKHPLQGLHGLMMGRLQYSSCDVHWWSLKHIGCGFQAKAEALP